MDYRTLYTFDVVSLAVYAVATSMLAIKNKKIRGMGWFAGAVLIDVGKTGLQALRGQVPSWASLMLANELNVLSFLAMYLGFRWFLVRTPLRGWMWRGALAGTMGLYAVLFLARAPYTFALGIAPVLVITYVWFCVTMIQGRLARFAQTDALTGVLNRRALEIEADREMARCEQGESSVVLFAIDLDHFKRVNDTFGHRGGDLALRELVQTMKRELRLVDVVARAGGDEFVVLLPDIGVEAALRVAERLRSAVAQSRTPFHGGVIEMTISVGVSEFIPTDGSWHAALDRADRALYNCKKAGRNGVVLDREPTVLLPASLDSLKP